jgi:CDP-diacylglycerol---glycerol-3-phosphate 3-phosphatidyltransferase
LISSRLGHALDPAIFGIYRFFFRDKQINPNLFTLLGVLFSFLSLVSTVADHLVLGGIFLVISSFFDLMDGAVARRTGTATDFGGFLDSVLDRYSDLFVMCGILIYFVKRGAYFDVIATSVASMGIAIIPYARARAEAAGFSCRAGLLERPERLAILVCGLFFAPLLRYVVLVLAVLTHVTVIQRIIYTRKMTGERANREIRIPPDYKSPP